MASFKDKFKNAGKKLGGFVIKGVKYGAPVIGLALGGTAGAAAGTAVSALAATHRAKNKKAAVTRALAYGGIFTGAGALLNVASGTSLTTGALKAVPALFGAGSNAKASGAAIPGESNPNAAESLTVAAQEAFDPRTAAGGQVADRPGVIDGPLIPQGPGGEPQGTGEALNQQSMGGGMIAVLAIAAYFVLRKKG